MICVDVVANMKFKSCSCSALKSSDGLNESSSLSDRAPILLCGNSEFKNVKLMKGVGPSVSKSQFTLRITFYTDRW